MQNLYAGQWQEFTTINTPSNMSSVTQTNEKKLFATAFEREHLLDVVDIRR